MARLPVLVTLLLTFGLAIPATGQVPDVSGSWKFDTTAGSPTMAVPASSPVLFGHPSKARRSAASAMQSWPGDRPPAPDHDGLAQGTVDEKGCVDGSDAAGWHVLLQRLPGKAMGSLQGDFGNETGPYAGGGGSFEAIMVAIIPTLGAAGLTALAVLVLAIGGWRLRRRALV